MIFSEHFIKPSPEYKSGSLFPFILSLGILKINPKNRDSYSGVNWYHVYFILRRIAIFHFFVMKFLQSICIIKHNMSNDC